MATRFTLVTKDYQDYATDLIGISKDNFIQESAPTTTNGTCPNIRVAENAGAEQRIVLETQMPSEDDIVGFDSLFKVEISLEILAGSATESFVVAVIEITDVWDEGPACGGSTPGVNASNWDEAQVSVPWIKGSGAIKSNEGSLDDSETVIDSVFIIRPGLTLGTRVLFDLTSVLSMGDKKTFVLFVLDNITGNIGTVDFHSREATFLVDRPILRVTHRSFPPDGFEGENGLTINPNPNDLTQPLLSWKAVKVDDFFQYKLYRSTSPITSVDGFKSAITAVSTGSDYFEIDGDHLDAFPVGSTFKITGRATENGKFTVAASSIVSGDTRIEVDEDVTVATVDGDIHHGIWTSTDSAIEEFIDTDSLSAGTKYYYRLIAEDQDNHEDNALLSATVFFTVPTTTARTLSPSGAQNVGTEITISVTSAQNIKRLYVDWKDGSTSWYEYETVGLIKTAKHIYSKHSGAGTFTPDIRIEDEFGFWSAIQATSNNVDMNDTTPIAKLLVNVKKAVVGDTITINGHLSQPQASNSTITKYEFKRHENDSWQDNGADPVYEFTSTGVGFSGAITEFADMGGGQVRVSTIGHGLTNGDYVEITGTTNYDGIYLIANVLTNSFRISHSYDGDDATGTWNRNGTVQASLRITTSTSLQDTDTTTYDLETGTPTELVFTVDTKIHELPHRLGQDKMIESPLGGDGVEHEFLISRPQERLSLIATSNYPNAGVDIGILRNAWLNNLYVRIWAETEMENKRVRYDCKLDGDISLGQSLDNKISWTFPIRVISRTEV